jgi:phage major head subunit gpT-like protein
MASMLPDSVDEEARTVEVVWSSGARVPRRDRMTGEAYEEVLSLDPEHVDLSRLNGGAPLLDTHGAWSLDGVIGVVERAWIVKGDNPEGRALVRFSERDDVEPVWRDVRAGIIRNVSVGYSVRAYEITDEEGKVPLWRAVDWTPAELSAVPIGADPDAGFRSAALASQPCRLITRSQNSELLSLEGDNTMEHQDTPETPAEETRSGSDTETVSVTEEAPREERRAAVDAAAGKKAAVKANDEPKAEANTDARAEARRAVAEERSRAAGIYDTARKLGVERSLAEGLVMRGMPLDQARKALIDAVAERDERTETRSQITMGGMDERQTRQGAVEAALLHRFDPSRFDLPEPAREWRGYSLLELARAFLEADGTRVRGLSRDEIATRALHSTSDFPDILAAVTNKTLRDAYQAAPRTFPAIARRASASDFKDIRRLQLGEAPQLEKVAENGEFKRGTMGEGKESYRVETYGKVIGITRQVIINDDLDAFTRVPSLFGTSAATLESDVVWGIITSNPAMGDNKALFHAGHKNLAGTGTALDVANLGQARAFMARQVGLDGKTILNIRPAYLVVPSTLELTAEQIIAQNLVPAKSGDVVPQSIRSLAVIAEPRLDPASGAVPWYLFASPAQIDTIEYAYLEGQEGVYIETRMGFDVDGIEVKARLDFGAKAIDWRGMHKNPGV